MSIPKPGSVAFWLIKKHAQGVLSAREFSEPGQTPIFEGSAFSFPGSACRIWEVRSSKIWILVAIAALAIMFFLNPTPERNRAVFMQSAETRFFDLPPEYQQIFQQVRSETLRGKNPANLRYKDLLFFSMLQHVEESPRATGINPKSRLLTFGAMGFVFPVSF